MLVIVDIHKYESAAEITLDYIEKYKPDLLAILGDITTFSPLEFAENFLAELPDIKTLALPGNCDPKEVLRIIDESRAMNFHGKKETIDGIRFVGLGGSNYTPFNTPFELTEEEIYQTLNPIMESGVILLLHGPSKGHLDLLPNGRHTGSESILKLVEKYKPSLVLSGHIHETRGTETDAAGVIYLNPGPMRDGYAALVDITPNEHWSLNAKMSRYECKIKLLPESE